MSVGFNEWMLGLAPDEREPEDNIPDAVRDLDDERFEHVVNVIGYGPKLYLVCDSCNYQTHRCMFCGDDLTHAEDRNGTHIRECRPDIFEDEDELWQ